MSDELISRLDRIYASINATLESDMTQLPAKVLQDDGIVGICQDFAGNLTEAEIENRAYTVIQNVANLRDHLKRWGATNRPNIAEVDNTFNSSMDIQIIADLCNNDKHGYPPRGSGHSGRRPKLINPRAILRVTGRNVRMMLGSHGVPKIQGGTAIAIITGEVVDEDGNTLGDLYDIALRAVKSWELLLKELGLLRPDDAGP